MDKISIALCTYNGAHFLNDQLESFLAQTRLPDELVICDDCSDDETVSIIKIFSKIAPFPVRFYVNEKNLGSTKNFERAISLCSGDIIFLSDQDDVWKLNKIELIAGEFFKSKSVGIIFSDAELVDENLVSLKKNVWDFSFPAGERAAVKQDGLFKLILRKNIVTGATMAFRKNFRIFFSPIPTNLPNMMHDGWIALIISAVSDVVFIDKPLIKYRQHSKQQLGIDSKFNLKEEKIHRQDYYRNSLLNLQKELQKLSLLKNTLNDYSHFQQKVDNLMINSLIDDCYGEVEEIVCHYQTRMNLSPSRLKRIFQIYKEISTGRYHRFSKGLKSAAKDIYESW
ncbi:hypothetical protein BH20ACI4_BH20ACI4_33310 [soil metagenome]